jgi:hypothetical protein
MVVIVEPAKDLPKRGKSFKEVPIKFMVSGPFRALWRLHGCSSHEGGIHR